MARGDADGACDGLSVAVPELDSWLMELKPPSNRRVVPSVLHVLPREATHDQIYCVRWDVSDKFTI
ncbi:hypothetical protein GA0115240_146121 [Streptomyces sp. DvalAA-14]|nr:hypothetical protein GA0115240_146121 [Streptomyces sp. DvalAA-14]